MPLVTLTFSEPINTSAQVGDTVYYISTTAAGTFNWNHLSQGIELGELISFQNKEGLDPPIGPLYNAIPIEIRVNCGHGQCQVPAGSFIMFSKNKAANTSGIIGYYAKIKLTNNSDEFAEIFSIGSDATINSQ